MKAAYPEAGRRYEAFLAEVLAGTGRSSGGAAAGRVEEPGGGETGIGPMPELEVQARWFAGEFGRRFAGSEGEEVEIVQFGHWNRGAGPDFTEAAVRVGGELKAGAIEVDLEAESWETHGHGANPAFEAVVLHVFVGGAGSRKSARFYTRDRRHRAIPQLALDLAALPGAGPPRLLPEAKRGRCADPLADMDEGELESLLLGAAQARLARKARRLEAMGAARSAGQALYQALAEALGYRRNSLPLAVLAQRLPVAGLRRRDAEAREALLFGVAGFLDHEHYASAADPEAKAYLKTLWDHWWKLRDLHEPSPDRRLEWNLAGSRPVNHPQRRVAALSALAGSWPRLRRLAAGGPADPAAWWRALRDHLLALEHPYWNRHYTLRAQPAAVPLALVGDDRARDLLGNVLFPFALNAKPGLWDGYLELPGAAPSESLRRARLRLFGGEAKRAARWSRRYWQQQALLQIYRDFCLEDLSDCAGCPFPEQLKQWRA